jgi:uncharacterized protein (TIGR03435 family)
MCSASGEMAYTVAANQGRGTLRNSGSRGGAHRGSLDALAVGAGSGGNTAPNIVVTRRHLGTSDFIIVAHARTAVKSGDDIRPLVKTLLADRFGLQAHSDVQQVAAFVLHVAQGGSKLRPAPAFLSELSGGSHPGPGIWANDDVFVATYISQKELTQQISRNMRRPVIDQTGLAGPYDFTLRGPRTPEALPAELQEQLGLQLDAVTAPIDVIVVDDIRQPTLDVQSAAASSADD